MSNINNPDIDPADNYSLVGTINFAFQKLMQSMNGMLPAQVTAYDRETNRASLQILINLVTTNNQQVARPHLESIPVLILGGGTFSISFPLKAGDVGWLLANDRDISLFLQTYKQNPPNTFRMNNFADGLFIPDIMKTMNFSTTTENYMIIQSNDGSMNIELGIDTSDNNAPSVNINAGRINLNLNNASTGYTVIDGNLFVSGVINNPTGTVTPLPTPPPYTP
jgi:Phage protein Gp138 N-terminal domain